MAQLPASFAVHVAHKLASPCPQNLHRYLVFDLAAFHRHEDVGTIGQFGEAIDLLLLRPVDWAASASPALIAVARTALSAREIERWNGLALRWQYANAITYFEHTEGIDQLARRLSERSRALLPDGMEVLLRWFDNRVLGAMLSALGESKRQALAADMVELAYSDRRGMVCCPRLVAGEHGESRLILSIPEERALIEATEPDALIDLLLQQSQPNLMTMLPPDQYDCICSLSKRAMEFDIDQVPDQIAFCSLGLELGPGFVDHLPWSEILVETRKSGGRLTEVLARFDLEPA